VKYLLNCESDSGIADMGDSGGRRLRRQFEMALAWVRTRELEGGVRWNRVGYMGRGFGTGVNRVRSKSSNLRRALSRAVPSNWRASRVKLTTGSWV